MSTRMRVDRLSLDTKGGKYDFDFSSPCTILEGPVGTGKSSLLELIKYSLGGSAVLTPAVRDEVTSVQALIQLGDSTFLLRRGFSREKSIVEILDSDNGNLIRRANVRAKLDQVSISDFLMETLGLPQVSIPRARSNAGSASIPLTFFDLYSYLYVEQQGIDRSIVHHTEIFREPKRRAMFELLFGLTEPGQLLAETRLGKVRDGIRTARARLIAVENFLQTAMVESQSVLLERMATLEEAISEAISGLNHLRDEVGALTTAHQQLRERLALKETEVRAAEESLRLALSEVTRRKRLMAQLALDSSRVEKTHSAHQRFGSLEFVVCPRCMQDVSEDRASLGACTLCLQPTQFTETLKLDEEQVIEDSQLQESEALLEIAQTQANLAQKAAQTANERLKAVRDELDRVTAEAVAPRFQEIELLSARRAEAAAEQRSLKERLGFWEEHRRLQAQLTALEEEQGLLESSIEAARARTNARRSVLDDLSESFEETVLALQVPWAESAHIDPKTYLPIVNGERFETLAVAGGTKTVVTVAYHLTLLAHCLQDSDCNLTPMLVLDTPRKNLGSNISDSEMSARIYRRIRTLVDAYGKRTQFIIADNDVPTEQEWSTIHFDYKSPLLPHVLHPGEEAVLSGSLPTIGSNG